MSDFKGIMKNGWHPKGKDGGKESWRGDFKGINQVAGWMGKAKQPGSGVDAGSSHTSRPLASLKDPSSFGPPPKNVNYHGGAALPNEITPHRGGLGAPLTEQQINGPHQNQQNDSGEQEEQDKPAPPPVPYRADRTGLKTDHLPPPPVHRDIQNTGQQTARVATQPPSLPPTQPRLPPRLPARQNTASSPVESPPPSYDSIPQTSQPAATLNQSAMNRLGRAGVSVPGLGIGASSDSRQEGQGRSGNQLSELQQRFSRMNTNSSPVSSQAPQHNATSPSAQTEQSMPSWQQSQSAFQTAQNLRTNPQSVTVADAQNAAQTAEQAQTSVNTFREKHADSIAKAQTKAKAWDQKYKFSSKINKYLDENAESENNQAQQSQPQPQQHAALPPPQQPSVPAAAQLHSPQVNSSHTSPQQPAQTQSPRSSAEMAASISRKPPPPPPPKKPANMQAPPPVPVGTKPSFG